MSEDALTKKYKILYKEVKVKCPLGPGCPLLGTECSSGRERCTVANTGTLASQTVWA